MPVSFTFATIGAPTSSVGRIVGSMGTGVSGGVVVNALLFVGEQAAAHTRINSSIGRQRQRLKYDTDAPLPKGCDFNYSQTLFFAHKGGSLVLFLRERRCFKTQTPNLCRLGVL